MTSSWRDWCAWNVDDRVIVHQQGKLVHEKIEQRGQPGQAEVDRRRRKPPVAHRICQPLTWLACTRHIGYCSPMKVAELVHGAMVRAPGMLADRLAVRVPAALQPEGKSRLPIFRILVRSIALQIGRNWQRQRKMNSGFSLHFHCCHLYFFAGWVGLGLDDAGDLLTTWV